MNGPTPVPEVNGTENGSVMTTTKKPKLTRNQLKRERKKQKKVQSQAHSRAEYKEGGSVVEIGEKASFQHTTRTNIDETEANTRLLVEYRKR